MSSSINASKINASTSVKIDDATIISTTDGTAINLPTGSEVNGQLINTSGVETSNITGVTAGDSPYSVASSDVVIVCNTTNGTITINLPAASSSNGRLLRIIDSGNAGTNAITIAANGSDTIQGNATLIMNIDNESISTISVHSVLPGEWRIH